MQRKVEEINRLVRDGRLWFDFDISSFNGHELEIIGGIDLSYLYEIEIKFSNVSFLSGYISLHIDTSKDFLFVHKGSYETSRMNLPKVRDNSYIFEFKTDDIDDLPFIVMAEQIEYKYERVNL
ncbi:hypothetical protein [Listeria monocytogenes]|uniref:hypothetical protein n=1 Tax=Listeria monocytogenes TaxID=1639 RepID=UPI0001EB8A23|nr:hypothetical protein [Listeria monocytogenes]EFR84832.1 hypothetical protein NT04LM_1947 [Listeria monocytogenes FSL F2-208]EAD7631422.1 hypothetical protein [Listeria monocytogenes]EEP6659226.1 hypothetical protein [Listeria monocytogenes]EFQ9068604.1 hypothetical protein [Listeria monocytogenes]EGU0985818.1 hypothetical protein [Listeria monocytogenes]